MFQGEKVRNLKAKKANKEEIDREVKILLELKKQAGADSGSKPSPKAENAKPKVEKEKAGGDKGKLKADKEKSKPGKEKAKLDGEGEADSLGASD